MPLKKQFKVLETLHENANTLIYRAIRLSDNKSVILKSLKPLHRNEFTVSGFINEQMNLSSFRSKHIIKFIDVISTPLEYIHVLEDIGGSSLHDILLTQKLDFDDKIELCVSLAKALLIIHQHHIVHTDINPKNIIYNPKTKQVQFIDFDAAISNRTLHPNQDKDSLSSSWELLYMSPEQTGLTSNPIDFRSDLYSFGMSMYYLFLGHIAFDTKNKYELTHKQIAFNPPSLHDLDRSIPLIISQIIQKLINKNPLKRYQNTDALVYDLEKVLKDHHSQKGIREFELNSRNRPVFNIGTQIFGREKELKTLSKACHMPHPTTNCQGLVSGHSGVGKTRLVNEFFKATLPSNIQVLKGKFDQEFNHLPYLGFKHIFSQLRTLLLSRQGPQILSDLSRPSVSILHFIFPELRKVLPSEAAHHKVALKDIHVDLPQAVIELFEHIANKESPFLIFLDDLQWSDQASTMLLKTAIFEAKNPYLNFIGAYRPDELKQNKDVVELLEQNKSKFNFHIHLLPLDKDDILAMFTTLFASKSKKIKELASLIYAKTEGNPFYVKTLTQSLIDTKEVYYKNGKWDYSTEQVQLYSASKNIADIINTKFRRLNLEKQSYLCYLAILGNQFDIELTLSMMSSLGFKNKLIHSLQDDGFIYLTDTQYQFVHDQIQENVFNSIPSQRKKKIHFKIGKFLEVAYQHEKYNDYIKLVEHLNQAYEDGALPSYLFTYNTRVLSQTLQNNAYQLALEKLHWIQEHLENEASWKRSRKNTFEFKLLKAKTLYLNTQHIQAKEVIQELFNSTKTLTQKRLCFSLSKDICVTQGQGFDSLLKLGETLLTKMGLNIPKDQEELNRSISKLDKKITLHPYFKNPNKILKQTRVYEGKRKAISSLLMDYWESAFYLADLDRMKWAYLNIVYISFRYGNTSESSFGYVLYGAQLVAQKEYQKSYLFANLSLKLNHLFNDKGMLPKINNFVANFISPYTKPLIDNVSLYEASLHQSKLNGDIVFGTWANFLMHFSYFLSGQPLDDVMLKIQLESDFIKNSGDTKMISIFDCLVEHIKTLQNGKQTALDEDLIVSVWETEKFYPALAWYALIKAQYCFLRNELDKGLEYLEKYLFSSDNEVIMFSKIRVHFIRALLLLAKVKQLSAAQEETLRLDLDELGSYTTLSSANFKFEELLLQAETMKASSSAWDVAKVYDKALSQARKQKNSFFLSLAGLCAGRFWKNLNYTDLSDFYTNEALITLNQWGAFSLVKELKTSQLSKKEPVKALSKEITKSTSLHLSDSNFKSILTAFNSISKAQNTQDLISSLMQVILQNATASKAVLIIEDDDKFFVRSSIDFQSQEINYQKFPLENFDFIPHSVISYSINTTETVDLKEPVKQGSFQLDPYIQEHQPASCLCLPSFFEGKLKGILYLENKELSTPLSQDTLQTLELFLTQALIVYKNTSLYETLQLSEAALNKAQEISHVGSWVYNSETHNIVWSAETYRIYDLEPFSIPMNLEWFYSHLYPSDLDYIKVSLENALNGKMDYNVTHRIVLPNGKIKYVHQRAKTYVESGVKIVSGTIQDITESEKSKERISQLSQVVEQTPFSIFITDIDGYITYCNKQALDLSGYTSDEVIAQKMSIFRSNVQSKAFYSQLWQTIKNEKGIWQGLLINKMKDGKLIDCQSTIFPIFNQNQKVINFVTIQEDTTQRNIKDKLFLMQTRQAQMGEMLSMIAHQWRQPLSVMIALLNKQRIDIALERSDFSDISVTFDELEDQIQHLSGTITDFRDFFKPDKKKSLTNSETIVSKSFSLIENVYKQKAIKTEFNYIDDTSYQTYEGELVQVILNLFKNAQDAFEERKIKNPYIKVTCQSNSAYAIIQVQDNAHGIEEEVKDTLFLPYVSTKNQKQGTGLGLYMSKTIIEEHCHGSILVENIGDGARFTIKLPLENTDESK